MEELFHSNVFNGMVALNARRGQAGSEGARQPVLGYTGPVLCQGWDWRSGEEPLHSSLIHGCPHV